MFRRIVPFAAVAVVASLLIVVPALGSSHEDAVRLHLGSDSRSFSYDGVTQSLTVARNGCQINSPEPLIDLSSTGTTQPGLASLSIGVKSSGSNSNGTPCSQVDSLETLSLARTGSTLAGRSFNKVRLDVEMTGDAVVKVDFFVGTSSTPAKTATLQTGTNIQTTESDDLGYDTSAPYEVTTANYLSDENQEADPTLTDACAAPNSSGPNNAGNDNCLWTIDPGISFDRVVLTTTHGTVSLEGSADFANDPGHDSLLYLANAAPTAGNDSYSTDEDTTLNVTAPGVLGNDADADGDAITAVLGTDVSNGTLALNADGSFSYTPNANYFGPDSFTYTATDGTASSTAATVSITVNAVNDPPQAAGDATVDEDSTSDVTVATDIDDEIINSDCTSSAGGTVTDNGDGTVTYTPPPDFSGTDTLVCSVNDGEATVSIDVTVNVTGGNDGPVANPDEGFVDAGASVTIDVLANDTDVDGDALSVSAISQGSFGSVIDNGDGTVTYSADADLTGSDSFTYTVSDGNDGTDPSTVTIWELFQCDETLSVSDGSASATYTRLAPNEGGCGDQGKPYEVELTTTFDPGEGEDVPTVIFEPRPLVGTPVEDCSIIPTPAQCTDEFAAVLTFDPRPKTNPPTTGMLQYDPVARDEGEEYVFRNVEWCEIPNFDPYAEPRPPADQILPAGESWCVASASVAIYSDTQTLTTWTVYGIGDPAKRG